MPIKATWLNPALPGRTTHINMAKKRDPHFELDDVGRGFKVKVLSDDNISRGLRNPFKEVVTIEKKGRKKKGKKIVTPK